MTFTEAAIEVLRREGKPLHFKKIAEIAVRESLLDHVGKIPDEVMGGQLAAHCKLPHADRKVTVVQSGTFALSEWGLDEDPTGLDSVVEPPPLIDVPYRPRERHPTPSRDVARSTGRAEVRARRHEEGEERRGRRFPPPAEVAYEILAGADRPLALSEIAAQGAERFLMPDAFVRDAAALGAALAEDNRRRESAGRKPLFALDGDQVSLAAQPEPGERAAAPISGARPAASAAELRRSALGALRRRVRECDAPTVEHVVARLLERMGLHELKVAKRGREHVVYTAKRRMGLGDVRHCVRILRSGAEAGRRDVGDTRRDVGNYGAQIGVVVSAGEAGREARAEAILPGQVPVLLLCGEALAEALTEHGVGCRPIVVPEVDDAFFAAAAEAATAEEASRRARREERDRRERDGEEREGRGGRPRRERGEAAERGEARAPADAAPPPVAVEASAAGEPERPAEEAAPTAGEPAPRNEIVMPAALEGEEEGPDEGGPDDEGEEEGPEAGAAAAPGAEGERTGEGRRRRRRRRRRGGRGRHREGQAGAQDAAAPGAPAGAPPPGGEASPAAAPAPAAEPETPPLPPGPQGGEG
jgi:hypothetical protein